MFQNVKLNDQIMVVESSNNFKVYRAQVTEVGQQKTVMDSQNRPVQVVSVIKATDGQQPFEFKELPAGNAVFTYMNGTIVASSRDAMAMEMRRLNGYSREVINSVPNHHAIVAGTESVLEDIDPEYAEKKQMRQQMDLMRQQNAELLKAREQQEKAIKEFAAEIKSLREEIKGDKPKPKTEK